MGSQTDQIVDHIVREIEQGGLMPGDVLEEKALVSQFGVSRTPVREALLQLDALGILRRKPRGGAEVFKPNLEEFLAILEVHAKLEGHAAGLAARRLSAEDGRTLEQAVRACEDHLAEHGDGEPDRYYLANLNFHRLVAVSSHNPVLLETIKVNARKLLAYYRARYRYKHFPKPISKPPIQSGISRTNATSVKSPGRMAPSADNFKREISSTVTIAKKI